MANKLAGWKKFFLFAAATGAFAAIFNKKKNRQGNRQQRAALQPREFEQEEHFAPPPVDPGKDDSMPDPAPVKPDAGKLADDLHEIVTNYLRRTEEAYSADKALSDVNAWCRDVHKAFPDDKVERDNADELALNARDQIRQEFSRRKDEAAHAAHLRRENELSAARSQNPPPPGGGGGSGGTTPPNNFFRNVAIFGGMGCLGIIGLLLLVAVVGAVIAVLVDDDEDTQPASNGSSAVAAATDIDKAASNCPDSVRDQCKAVLQDVKESKKSAAQAQTEIAALIANASMSSEDKVERNTGDASQVLISSSQAGGGPNTDAIYTGDCEVVQVGNVKDRIYIRSGVKGECSHTFSNIPKGWQMTVDGVDFTVNGVKCVGCTKGFELDSMGSTATVRIHNGAAVLGIPEVARARYCTAYGEGVDLAHDNAHNPSPLPTWKPCE